MIYYQFELKDLIKNNKTFIKELKQKKIIRTRIKLKTSIHDKKKFEHVNFLNAFFYMKNHKCQLKKLCTYLIK
jgi:3-methyladenine DNA glycosylase Tag